MFVRVILLVTIFIQLPGVALAQLEDFTPQNQLVISPESPIPGQVVTIKLDDYAGGLFGSSISWRYNGELIEGSTNQRSIEVEAGTLGEMQTVEAILSRQDGSQETISRQFVPVYIDIIVEPQTRVPDWFLGRAMPSIDSQVNATVVVSDGEIINPLDYVYTWRINQTIIDEGPLRGRNSVSFETPRGNDMILGVIVRDTAGQFIASEIKEVPSVNPDLLFYEQHPLYGSQPFPITNSFSLVGNTLTLQAEPLYLDTNVYNDPDVAEWELNRTNTNNGSRNPYEITLQRAAVFGNTNINFHVRSLQQVLQGTEESVTISF